ncbi:MAG: hypothetical protein H6970_05150 [Gammaproteobacteria bacterium]|nr:hypothetical protein [Gammaproteobacteria bacterium]MCP5424438.1 hypothetical protein [Gammaproteobacteria bacterium]MCP5458432.1 hypothetical protein [Gammaproteobacteria bacterium]
MNPDVFNTDVRKFLKKVGVTSQQQIETAVQDALEKGELGTDRPLMVSMTLTIKAVGVTHVVEGKINLR